jgi:transcription elongation factor Elf1
VIPKTLPETQAIDILNDVIKKHHEVYPNEFICWHCEMEQGECVPVKVNKYINDEHIELQCSNSCGFTINVDLEEFAWRSNIWNEVMDKYGVHHAKNYRKHIEFRGILRLVK